MPDHSEKDDPNVELPQDAFDDPGAVAHPDQSTDPLPGSVS